MVPEVLRCRETLSAWGQEPSRLGPGVPQMRDVQEPPGDPVPSAALCGHGGGEAPEWLLRVGGP
ncbi:unnamed protein product [Effrenium voratum]|nr:unnamed protein product [Effrenium voratum]